MLTERYDAKKDPMWSEPVVDIPENGHGISRMGGIFRSGLYMGHSGDHL